MTKKVVLQITDTGGRVTQEEILMAAKTVSGSKYGFLEAIDQKVDARAAAVKAKHFLMAEPRSVGRHLIGQVFARPGFGEGQVIATSDVEAFMTSDKRVLPVRALPKNWRVVVLDESGPKR